MQKILGYLRKACERYDMIADGDMIAVGVSGGKDSLVLLKALAEYRRFAPVSYELRAVTVDMRLGGRDTDLSYITQLCAALGVEHTVLPTDIGQVVFDVRKEPNPCSLCARMRRGALLGETERLGCNKLALGHNNDDAVETFFMNLFNEGRIGCFSPVTRYLDRGLALIRPLVLAPEKAVISCARRNGITPVKSGCPKDKHTAREEIKAWLTEREKSDRGFTVRISGALERGEIDGWRCGSGKQGNSPKMN